MIKQVERQDIELCAQVIRKSFETVAKKFNITEKNCPGHTSFIKTEKLNRQYDEKRPMYVYFSNETIIGYFSLCKNSDSSYELDNLAVLPEYRHRGYGKAMIDFAKDKVKEFGGNKITIGIIEENEILKSWYGSLGFKHTEIKKFEHLPFTVGFMELDIESVTVNG